MMRAPRESVALRQSRASQLSSGPAQPTFGQRSCSTPGCATKLSRYNPAATCSVHAGWTDEPRARNYH